MFRAQQYAVFSCCLLRARLRVEARSASIFFFYALTSFKENLPSRVLQTPTHSLAVAFVAAFLIVVVCKPYGSPLKLAGWGVFVRVRLRKVSWKKDKLISRNGYQQEARLACWKRMYRATIDTSN